MEPEPLPNPAPPGRVILLEESAKARVEVEGNTHEGVPILAARMRESDEELFGRSEGDVVLLKERATHASVRLQGVTHADLPIYKEVADAEGPRLMRVRVAEIRDRTEKKGLLSRLIKRN